jgi:hypothetical protein
MGKAIGLEIRKVFGVKLTDEEKTNLATSMLTAKLSDEVKEEKEIKIEEIDVGPSSSRVGIVA